MPRSKPKRASAAPAPRARSKGGAKAGRWQTLGLFVTLLAVAALVGSLAWGVWEHVRAPSAAAPAPAPAESARRPAAPAGRVRVQVLNATPTKGLARRATDVLRDRGYDVLEMGNAPRGTNPAASVVYDRVGNLEAARGVGAALGIARVETRRDPTLLLEVTVVLGSDWRAPGPVN
jgi:hypothetical protein